MDPTLVQYTEPDISIPPITLDESVRLANDLDPIKGQEIVSDFSPRVQVLADTFPPNSDISKTARAWLADPTQENAADMLLAGSRAGLLIRIDAKQDFIVEVAEAKTISPEAVEVLTNVFGRQPSEDESTIKAVSAPNDLGFVGHTSYIATENYSEAYYNTDGVANENNNYVQRFGGTPGLEGLLEYTAAISANEASHRMLMSIGFYPGNNWDWSGVPSGINGYQIPDSRNVHELVSDSASVPLSRAEVARVLNHAVFEIISQEQEGHIPKTPSYAYSQTLMLAVVGSRFESPTALTEMLASATEDAQGLDKTGRLALADTLTNDLLAQIGPEGISTVQGAYQQMGSYLVGIISDNL